MTYKTNGHNGAIVLHSDIPTLQDLFDLIEKGKLAVEEDEVVTYYYDFWDQQQETTCVSSLHQLMDLYKIRKLLVVRD